MRRAIVVPEIGAGAALISAWYAHLGERVYAGDRVVELLLGAATFDVTSPVTGMLVERLVSLGDHVAVGQVVGYVEEEDDA